MRRSVTLASIGLVGVVIMMGLGCEQKLTYQRYELIHMGQEQLGVEKTLGEPVVKMTDQWTWNDSDRSITAHVWFNQEGKVLAKQWFDPKRGMVGGPPGGDATQGGEVIQQKTKIMVVQ
ncbi:MAG: hypothetical protein JXQ73_33245 [Phycisphaerae bacterium]|nr:hypothetical protein [Phycisphaerae bacterium]